jgi:predicted sulfurtransferase
MKPRFCMILSLVIALILVALTGYSAPPASVEQVPRLTKEAVKEMLGKPDVVIVDIRYIKQYEQSNSRLPGAVFVQPENFDEFAKNYPKDKTYVLY